MTKIKAANVQAIVNWSIEPAQAIVIKNARQIGLKIPIFQSHGFGNIKYVEAAGAAAEGVMFPAGRLLVADVLPKNHPQKELLLKYKKDYMTFCMGEECSTFGGHAYDAFIILVEGDREGEVARTRRRSGPPSRTSRASSAPAASSTSPRRTTTASTSTPSRC